MERKNKKPNLVGRLKQQAVLSRTAFEVALIERTLKAFFIASAQELIERYNWTPAQCTDFLTSLSQRVRVLSGHEKKKQDGPTNLD